MADPGKTVPGASQGPRILPPPKKKRYLRTTSAIVSIPATSDGFGTAGDIQLPIGFQRNIRLLGAHVAMTPASGSITLRDLKMAILWQDANSNTLFSLFVASDTPPYGLSTPNASEIMERASVREYDVRWDDDITGNPQNVVLRGTALVSNVSAGALNVTISCSAMFEFIE